MFSAGSQDDESDESMEDGAEERYLYSIGALRWEELDHALAVLRELFCQINPLPGSCAEWSNLPKEQDTWWGGYTSVREGTLGGANWARKLTICQGESSSQSNIAV